MFLLCLTMFMPNLVDPIKIMDPIKKKIFIENRLATVASDFLGNVGSLSPFALCPKVFMPSLAQLLLTEWK